MNIKSISELIQKQLDIHTLSAEIGTSFIELTRNNIRNFNSERLDFGKYTEGAISAFYEFIPEFERKLNEMKNAADNMVNIVEARFEHQNQKMNDFMLDAHANFLHKTEFWRDMTEVVHNKKNFVRNSHILNSCTLSADNVIEGVSRGANFI